MTPIFRRFVPLAALCAAPALAQPFEDLEMLESRMSAELGAGIGEPGGPLRPLDRRLRLAACPEPAAIEPPVRGVATIACEPLGWRIRVAIAGQSGGSAGAAQAERAQPIIRRGDHVEVVAMSRSFTVSASGIAEQDGAPGDRIRVRTERRTSPIVGQVLADGRVALPGFN